MKRYNLTVKIFAGVAVNATSVNAARRAVQEKLESAVQLIDLSHFVVEGGEITGVFDVNWNELEEE